METQIAVCDDKNKKKGPMPMDRATSTHHPVVDFCSEETYTLCKKHESSSLFAKVLGKKVSQKYLSTHLNWLWDLAGTLIVVALENNFFLLKFPNSSAHKKALGGVPWLIDGHYISLRPWVPNFKPSAAFIDLVPVWVRLPELPIEYYGEFGLSRIGSAMGKLVKIDPVSENGSICKFARLCVEIDITRPLTSQIELPNGFLQTIQYEGLQVVCYNCGRFGHLKNDCSYDVVSNVIYSHTVSVVCEEEAASSSHTNTTTTSHGASSSNNYGPWIQVPPRRRHRANDSGLQQRIASGSGSGSSSLVSGSRFQVLGQEASNPKKKSPSNPGTNLQPHQEAGQGHKANLPSVSSISNHPPPKPHDQVPSPSPTPSLAATTSTSTKPPSYQQLTDSPNQPHKASSLWHLNPPQSSASTRAAGNEFYIQGVQRATQEREIKMEPYELTERNTEGSPRVFSIESKIWEIDIGVNISPLPTGNGNQHQINLIPRPIDHTKYPVPRSCKKKVVIWNCRRASEPKVFQAVKVLCKLYQPSILLLFVTGIDGTYADNAIRDLGFSCSYIVDPTDFTSGVWLLWREEEVNINITSTASHQIYASVQILPGRLELIFRGLQKGSWFRPLFK